MRDACAKSKCSVDCPHLGWVKPSPSSEGFSQERRGHSATRLANGQVMLTGGSAAGSPLASIEMFDPLADLIVAFPAGLKQAREDHVAVAINSNAVAIAGGRSALGPIGSVEIVDLENQRVSIGNPMGTARTGHSGTLLDESRIFVAGGTDGKVELDSAEIMDVSTGVWSTLPARMRTARRNHLALFLEGSGAVLLAGGIADGIYLATTEICMPVENVFAAAGPLTAARANLAGALLEDGVVLATGGVNKDGPQSACGVLKTPTIAIRGER